MGGAGLSKPALKSSKGLGFSPRGTSAAVATTYLGG
jgi:hypothetical protein